MGFKRFVGFFTGENIREDARAIISDAEARLEQKQGEYAEAKALFLNDFETFGLQRAENYRLIAEGFLPAYKKHDKRICLKPVTDQDFKLLSCDAILELEQKSGESRDVLSAKGGEIQAKDAEESITMKTAVAFGIAGGVAGTAAAIACASAVPLVGLAVGIVSIIGARSKAKEFLREACKYRDEVEEACFKMEMAMDVMKAMREDKDVLDELIGKLSERLEKLTRDLEMAIPWLPRLMLKVPGLNGLVGKWAYGKKCEDLLRQSSMVAALLADLLRFQFEHAAYEETMSEIRKRVRLKRKRELVGFGRKKRRNEEQNAIEDGPVKSPELLEMFEVEGRLSDTLDAA